MTDADVERRAYPDLLRPSSSGRLPVAESERGLYIASRRRLQGSRGSPASNLKDERRWKSIWSRPGLDEATLNYRPVKCGRPPT